MEYKGNANAQGGDLAGALKIGSKAPEFCLSDKDEKKICLKDFRGKWVVLYFYPKDNTSECTKEALDFTVHKRKVLICITHLPRMAFCT
jgi:peroxiredoxin